MKPAERKTVRQSETIMEAIDGGQEGRDMQ